MNKVFLSLGTNKGDKYYNLLQALSMLDNSSDIDILKISSFYKTEPVGPVKQDDFINMAALVRTSLKPYELLEIIHIVEEKLKRKRKIHWGPRTIDIDIIFYENIKINRYDLIIPHKEFKNRAFVLQPLLEISTDRKMREKLLKNLKKVAGAITKIKSTPNIIVSACLMGINCKYNGDNNYNHFLDKLKDNMNLIMVCPEILGGMPTPRNPVEINQNARVKSKKGIDYTWKFQKGAKESLKIAKKYNCKLAILKSRSPSCGYGKIYDGTFTKKLIDGNGITTDYFLKNDIKIILK